MFDDFFFENLSDTKNYDTVFEAIKNEILYKFDEFIFDLNSDEKLALMKFAKSDRKKYGLNKIFPRYKSQKIVNDLLNKNYIILEKTREKKPTPKHPKEKLPRHLRRYVMHDKIHFKSNFLRFWFRFVEPNLILLKKNKFDEVLEKIKYDFDNYSSLGLETLSCELLKKRLDLKEVEIYSFWTKEFEIDIFAKLNGFFIVGEVKYKERKVCKNILNLIDLKCQKLGISPHIVALFSKSGFSKELINLRSENLLLFELNDFKDLV